MEDNYDERSIISNEYMYTRLDHDKIHNIFANLSTKDTVVQEDNNDIIPTKIKLIYSIPSFGKMSCLVLLK